MAQSMFTNLEHFSTKQHQVSIASLSLISRTFNNFAFASVNCPRATCYVQVDNATRTCSCCCTRHPVRFHLDATAKFIFASGHHAAALYCLKGGTWLITPKGKANQNRQAPTIEYAKHQRCTYRMASFARLFGYIERCKTNCGFHNSTASNT